MALHDEAIAAFARESLLINLGNNFSTVNIIVCLMIDNIVGR